MNENFLPQLKEHQSSLRQLLKKTTDEFNRTTAAIDAFEGRVTPAKSEIKRRGKSVAKIVGDLLTGFQPGCTFDQESIRLQLTTLEAADLKRVRQQLSAVLSRLVNKGRIKRVPGGFQLA